jgi:hypothetical protein
MRVFRRPSAHLGPLCSPFDERFWDPLMRERQPPSRLLRGRRLCKVTLFVPEGCAEGLRQFARFHWSVTILGQSHPVATGHTGELARIMREGWRM